MPEGIDSDESTGGPFFRTVDWLAFLTTFVLTLAAYVYTLAPTVTLEDSGELVVAADYLGVPHPPGYPIWTLLAWFFQWVFHFVTFRGHPNPAWAVGFMSAFFGAAACAVLSLLVSRSGYDMLKSVRGITAVLGQGTEMLLSWVGGVAGGLLFAFSSVLWSQSVIVEVYSLNAFFLSLILLLTYRWICRPQEDLFLYIVAFLFGLGLTNHMSLLFAVGGLVTAILCRDIKLHRDCMAGGLWMIALVVFYKAGVMGSDPTTEAAATRQETLLWLGFALILLGWLRFFLSDEFEEEAQGDFWITVALFFYEIGWIALSFMERTRRRWRRPIDVVLIRGGGGVLLWGVACYLVYRMGLLSAAKRAAVSTGQEFESGGMVYILLLLSLVPATAAILVLRKSLMTQCKRFFIVVGLMALGLSFYFYLPLASDQNPPMNWGYPRTQLGFWHALSRGQYEKFSVMENLKNIVEAPGHFLNLVHVIIFNPKEYISVIAQFTWPIALFGVVSFLFLFRMNWKSVSWLITTVITFLCLTVLFVVVQWPELDLHTLYIGRVQYIQAHAIYALWISYGLVFLLAFIDSRLSGSRFVKYVGIVLAFLLPLALIYRNWKDEEYLKRSGGVEQNGHDFGWQFGHYQLQGIGAILAELEDDEEPPASSTYPPAMEPDAIFFGGTDPGRFVPTYMIYSAKVRPDVFLITQNALADNTYMAVMRDLYGENIWIPSQQDSNRAFKQYVEDVKAGRIPPGANVTEEDGRVSVQGVQGVMMINGILTNYIFEKNKHKHPFYIEESYVIPWMYPYLTPHGLIMKINEEPLPPGPLSEDIVKDDREFWDWYTKRLVNNPKFIRDVVARKTFSKLRTAIGGLYNYRRDLDEAEHAFRQAIELYDLSPEANFRLADTYAQQGKYVDAIQIMEEFLDKDRGNTKIEQYKDSLIAKQEKNRRRQELEPQLQQGADINLAVELLGIYRDLSHVAQFQNLGNQILSNPRTPPEVYRKVGVIATQGRDFNMASTAYRHLTQRTPDDYEAWIELAATQIAMRQESEVAQSLQTAVSAGGEAASAILRADSRFDPIRNTPGFQALLRLPAGPRPLGAPRFGTP